MTSIQDRPHYTLSARALADWLEAQPDKWWSVDGDPVLMSIVDFPCPTDELAPAIRQIGGELLFSGKAVSPQAQGEEIAGDKLDELAEVNPRTREKFLFLTWAGSGVDWLLLEDEPMVAD